ncbi:hypothetical protein BGW42_003085 [Actinomortierella wolfii]|nr:hypothetical protein BGW42_003085 [Actinomortierella wolfii]
MADINKEVGGGSAAMVALAAELSKHTASFQRVKQAGGIRAPKAVKKSALWDLKSRNLEKRQKHKVDHRQSSRQSKEKARSDDVNKGFDIDETADQQRMETLERKAQIYDAVKRGEKVSGRIRDELLIEYDHDDESQSEDEENRYGFSSSRQREALQEDYERRLREREERASGKLKHDPWVEYEDEFGRTRLVRQSELPPPPSPPREPVGLHNPANPFPVFQRSDMGPPPPSRTSLYGEEETSKTGRATHYDSKKERRAQGVGFYTFSKDEEERRAQMEALRNIRAETEKQHRNRMSIFEKRRADIEARKLKIQAKREKSLAHTLTPPTTA